MKNKITPTPWSIDKDGYIRAADGITWILHIPDEIGDIDAAAIVSAVNNTYGHQINPEAVPAMLNALNKVMEYFGAALYTDSPTPKIVQAAIEQSKL